VCEGACVCLYTKIQTHTLSNMCVSRLGLGASCVRVFVSELGGSGCVSKDICVFKLGWACTWVSSPTLGTRRPTISECMYLCAFVCCVGVCGCASGLGLLCLRVNLG
jgi:hypothetical protein